MEVIHILAGPVVGILITSLAFSDDLFIKYRVHAFFRQRGVAPALAEAIEDMISGGIAFATFLGNVYIFIINSLIAAIVFPRHDVEIIILIGEISSLVLVLQASFIYSEYDIWDLGEICPTGATTYDVFLRWEQVVLNLTMLAYFILGLSLS
ncbi:MAG TPA: hypothetical protein VGG57_02160 [Stellaceae bacterium]